MSDKQLKEALGELAGACSLCWNPKPSGVFDSTQASKFVDEYFEKIKGYLNEA